MYIFYCINLKWKIKALSIISSKLPFGQPTLMRCYQTKKKHENKLYVSLRFKKNNFNAVHRRQLKKA